MTAYIFLFIAAFFNACMDAFENAPNFNESIFKNLNKKFWLKSVSWEYARKIFSYKLDAWHISKTLMLLCLVLYAYTLNKDVSWWVTLLNFAIVWNGGFILFYHYIFKIK